jgi:histidinol-phosphate aminotransferase
VSRFWSKVVHELTPYVPGEQPKMSRLIKLNTNENPYGPSPKVLQALRIEAADSLRLYPDPNCDVLKTAISEFQGLTTAQVFVVNGSDEVLAHVFQALLKHDAPLLFPDITYSFYPVYCGLYGINYETVPLTQTFEIDIDDYLRPNGGIIFPNPNAPTGRLLALAEIERLLQANTDSVMVIDEAYVDFGGESAVKLVSRYPQLLVIHTLSKARSVAGLRVGYAVGQPELIEALTRVKDSFNSYPLDRFAIAGATAAMQDRAYFEHTCRKVIETREKLIEELQQLNFEILPSGANFIFARHAFREGAELATRLRERSIVVRHFARPARISPYLRITVGTESECQILVSALAEILLDDRNG